MATITDSTISVPETIREGDADEVFEALYVDATPGVDFTSPDGAFDPDFDGVPGFDPQILLRRRVTLESWMIFLALYFYWKK